MDLTYLTWLVASLSWVYAIWCKKKEREMFLEHKKMRDEYNLMRQKLKTMVEHLNEHLELVAKMKHRIKGKQSQSAVDTINFIEKKSSEISSLVGVVN